MMKKAEEGLRQRKRRQTRDRIAEVALALFVEKGFDAVTVDEIAAGADISPRSFLNYFANKEAVVHAWQIGYEDILVEAVAARPADEPLRRAAERAVISSVVNNMDERNAAVSKLIMETPALRTREQVLYLRLEHVLAAALAARQPKADATEVNLVAMAAIGAIRIGTEFKQKEGFADVSEAFMASLFHKLWGPECGNEVGKKAGTRAPRGLRSEQPLESAPYKEPFNLVPYEGRIIWNLEFTPREVAELAGTTKGAVEKAIEERVISARKVMLGGRERRVLGLDAVVYTKFMRSMPMPMDLQSKRDLAQAITATKDFSNWRYALSPAVELNVGQVVGDTIDRAATYAVLRDKLIGEEPEMSDGAPALRGTSVSVHSILDRLTAGDKVEDILEDHPKLAREAVETAAIYARSHPPRGRPGKQPNHRLPANGDGA